MFAVKRIVVGVELPHQRPWDISGLTPPCRLAVQQACEIAAGAQIPVTLVAVLSKSSGGWWRSAEEAERIAVTDHVAAEGILRQLIEQNSTTSGLLATRFEVRTGSAWEELIRMAGNRPDSLMICGTRPLNSLRRMIFGSTGLKLLRLSPGVVWLVKPHENENSPADIVAATDLGSVGMDVLHFAVALGRWFDARLHVLHVVDGQSRDCDAAEAESRVREQLAETDYRTLARGVKVAVEFGDADQGILQTVREQNADLLILGTSSKTGASGLLPGSTVERLLPELDCSVLALKPEGFRSMLPAEFWSL